MAQKDCETVRDYAIREGEFSIPLAVWELAMSKSRVRKAVLALVDRGVLREVAPAITGIDGGPAIYGYAPIDAKVSRFQRLALPPEPVGDLIPLRGATVPLTGQPKGWSDSPSYDRARQAAGHRLKANHPRDR